MREVFLSHAGADADTARRLQELLTNHDIPVWFSPHDLRGAQQWQDEIGAALDRCDWFIVILTPHAVNSMWVKRELHYALDQEHYDTHILPLLFRKCKYQALSWALPQLQMIDFTKSFARGCDELLRVLGKARRGRGRKKPE